MPHLNLLEKLKHTFLIRVFSKKSYAEAFRNGMLRMQSVRFYKEHEDPERGDRMEGALIRGPGKHFTITLGPMSLPGDPSKTIIIKDALDIQIDGDPGALDSSFLLCLYSFSWNEVFRHGVLRLPRSLGRFGSHAVGINAYNLVRAVSAKCAATIPLEYNYVSYESDDYHGDWGIFRKHKKYSHQREFRIAFRSPPSEEDSKVSWISVGSLEEWMYLGSVHDCYRLAHPCPACKNGLFMGVAAPYRTRRRRVQKKVDQRCGSAHHYQRCKGCRARHYVFKCGDGWKIRTVLS